MLGDGVHRPLVCPSHTSHPSLELSSTGHSETVAPQNSPRPSLVILFPFSYIERYSRKVVSMESAFLLALATGAPRAFPPPIDPVLFSYHIYIFVYMKT